MNKLILLGIAASLGAARLAFLPANPPVDLQPTNPGSAQTGHLNISGTATSGVVRSGTVFGNSTAATGTASGGDFRSASTAGRGIYALASSASGLTYGGFFQNQSATGRAVFGLATATSSGNYGGYFQSAGTSGRGVLGSATASSGATFGGYFTCASPQGIAVSGISTNASGGTGVYGRSDSLNGYAGYFDGRVNAGTLRTSAVEVYGTGVRLEGAGKTVYFNGTTLDGFSAQLSQGTNFGWLCSTQGGSFGLTQDGTLFAGSQDADGMSRKGKGVFYQDRSDRMGALYARNGMANGGAVNTRRGLYVESGGADTSIGVSAFAQSFGASQSTYGVEALAFGTAGPNYGVYGYAGGGTTNYAGYFSGLLYANTATAGVKSFLIDHPLDPENKYLEHSSIESDERLNLYRGVVSTDARGYADIAVPGWFEALNTDIQYQLTIVDTKDSEDFVLAKVVRKFDGRTFRIRTSAPKVEVDWQISGRRHDPTSEYLPLVVERDKPAHERGKYLVPEAFGKDASMAVATGSRKMETSGNAEPPARRKSR